MSMKLKKSTVEDVKARFEMLKKKKQEEKKEYSLAERLKDAKEEQERMQSYTKDVSFIILYETSSYANVYNWRYIRSKRINETENAEKKRKKGRNNLNSSVQRYAYQI